MDLNEFARTWPDPAAHKKSFRQRTPAQISEAREHAAEMRRVRHAAIRYEHAVQRESAKEHDEIFRFDQDEPEIKIALRKEHRIGHDQTHDTRRGAHHETTTAHDRLDQHLD